MAAPVANGLVGSILQRFVATLNGEHFGSQHTHAFYIYMLAFHIQCAHIYTTRHIHQGAYGSCGNTVLSGSGFCNDACLAHLAGKQNLAYGIVNFVGSCMVQVFALQVKLAAVFLAHAFGIIER